MDATRLELLLSDIWSYVFATFDAEMWVDGDDAGAIATEAENAAPRAFLARFDMPPAGRTIEQIATGEQAVSDPLSIPCPQCGAGVGTPCRNYKGQRCGPHRGRNQRKGTSKDARMIRKGEEAYRAWRQHQDAQAARTGNAPAQFRLTGRDRKRGYDAWFRDRLADGTFPHSAFLVHIDTSANPHRGEHDSFWRVDETPRKGANRVPQRGRFIPTYDRRRFDILASVRWRGIVFYVFSPNGL